MAAPATARERLIVALDVPTAADAASAVLRLGDSVGVYKIGLQLLFAGGVDLARLLAGEGKDVFLDVKLLDIDNTVAGAIGTIADLGVRFVTVHAYPNAMRAAVTARGSSLLRLLGVTVLTSMDDDDLARAGYADGVFSRVMDRAAEASRIGMDGVVASAAEARAIRDAVGPDLAIVTPGIRPAGSDVGDQKRVTTPRDAIVAGSDYLVVGRPILGAPDPRRAALAIVDEIEAALQ